MLKYNNIISRLGDEDKVRILTDVRSLSDGERASLGLPSFALWNMRHMLRDSKYPSPQALANSWDNKLISELSGELALSVTGPISNVIMTPSAKVRLSPYRNEMSEDIYLSQSLATEFSRGAVYAGASSAISGYYMTNTDAEFMDIAPSKAILNEFVVQPFKNTVRDGQATAVITDKRVLSDKYRDVNAFLSDNSQNAMPNNAFLVAEHLSVDDTVSFLINGGICLKGSASALTAALKRYHMLKKKQESGDLTIGDINAEIREGKAISPELLDGAVDRLLDFLLGASMERGKKLLPGEREELAVRAAKESVVLLKNNADTLPIAPKSISSVALIGGIAASGAEGDTLLDRCERLLVENGVSRVEKSQGYDFDANVITEDIYSPDAISAVQSCDVAVLFMGHGETRGKNIPVSHKLSLPANQLELADMLKPYCKKIIIVLEAGFGADVGFAEPFAAVVMAPFGVRHDASAIVDTLIGKYNPSGRLANTLYADMDGYYDKHLAYRNIYGVRSGRFVGYRYYTFADLQIGYPFGHGLSYTTFAYSKLEVSGDTVSFTVTNKGSRAGREVAQIYVGASDSQMMRPSRELCGYALIDLDAKESRRVSVKIQLPQVFDEANDQTVTEKCNYTVCVGSSSTDIRLSMAISGGERSIDNDREEKLCNYLQTESNIISDKYTLEAGYDIMNRSIKNIVCGIGAAVLAIAVGVYNALTDSAAFLGVLTAILAATGIVFFVLDAIERNQAYRRERARIAEENQKQFENAEELAEFSAERMFRAEFDVVADNSNASKAAVKENTLFDESLKYVDKKLDFSRAAEELGAFALERGLSIDEDSVRSIMASISSSRLLVFKDMSSGSFSALVSVLSEYFGTKAYIDVVDNTYVNEESVLFASDDEGHRVKKNMVYAIESAANVKERLHIGALDGVKCDDMVKYFAPYVKYAKNPFGYTVITVHNEHNKEADYFIPQNIWFAVNLAQGECYDMIPDSIAEIATVNTITLSKTNPSDKHTEVSNFYYYQVDYISERARNQFVISEDIWKKIDSLEKRVKVASPAFAIGNKMCVTFERFAAALMAAGVDVKQSVDVAMAVKLLPALVLAVSDKKTDDSGSLSDMFDVVFGDDDMSKCVEVLKNSEAFKRENYVGAPSVEKAKQVNAAAVETDNAPIEEARQTEEPSDETANSDEGQG